MKITRDAEEQRHNPRNHIQRPPPTPISLNQAIRIMQVPQGFLNPDAEQGKPQHSQQAFRKRFSRSRLAGERLPGTQLALENYNPPPTRSRESLANSSSYGSSSLTAGTGLDCSDKEFKSTMEEKTQNGTSSGAASRLNPHELNTNLTAVGRSASNMQALKTSPVPTTSILASGCDDKEEEDEHRIDGFYAALALNLPYGSIYVTYISRLPADWQRPIYQCADRDCAFHNGVHTNNTVSTCRADSSCDHC